MERDPRSLVHPGPDDPSVLSLQRDHRTTAIWEGIELPPLHCRRSEAPLRRVTITDDRVIQHLRTAGFYGAYRLRYIQLDWGLITALVERWRTETHTFHLPVGEATITLQDTAVLLGLPVDGVPVCGVDTVRDVQQWSVMCTELLGFTPADGAIDTSTLRLSALAEHLAHGIPADATEHFIACYARAYILLLIGGFLFGDKSSSRVKLMFLPLLGDLHAAGTFSWGSAALAWLYREMCIATKRDAKDISGPLILLQVILCILHLYSFMFFSFYKCKFNVCGCSCGHGSVWYTLFHSVCYHDSGSPMVQRRSMVMVHHYRELMGCWVLHMMTLLRTVSLMVHLVVGL